MYESENGTLGFDYFEEAILDAAKNWADHTNIIFDRSTEPYYVEFMFGFRNDSNICKHVIGYNEDWVSISCQDNYIYYVFLNDNVTWTYYTQQNIRSNDTGHDIVFHLMKQIGFSLIQAKSTVDEKPNCILSSLFDSFTDKYGNRTLPYPCRRDIRAIQEIFGPRNDYVKYEYSKK
uniref:SCP domain-containing protein n=1 Tax=Rhabditophanes sp. KR3021 TaxID=114890 RepID=A0AC35UGY5_9BILA